MYEENYFPIHLYKMDVLFKTLTYLRGICLFHIKFIEYLFNYFEIGVKLSCLN